MGLGHRTVFGRSLEFKKKLYVVSDRLEVVNKAEHIRAQTIYIANVVNLEDTAESDFLWRRESDFSPWRFL
jgi:hypothetical protein